MPASCGEGGFIDSFMNAATAAVAAAATALLLLLLLDTVQAAGRGLAGAADSYACQLC